MTAGIERVRRAETCQRWRILRAILLLICMGIWKDNDLVFYSLSVWLALNIARFLLVEFLGIPKLRKDAGME